MPVEDIRCAADREIVDDASLGERQAGHVAPEAQELGDRAGLAADVRRRAQQPFFQQADDHRKFGQVAIICFGVGLVMTPDLLAGEAAPACEQIIAVARKEIVGLAQHDLQAVPFELHVADDLRLEQADGIARGRVAVAGKEFIRDRCAADRAGRLEHGDLHALPRQIISAGQAVVAGANDDCIVHLVCRHSGGGFTASTPVLRPSSDGARLSRRNPPS